MSRDILKLEKISKAYQLGDESCLDVLKAIDLSVTTGDTLAIMGPSGCGKSTLLNIAGTLDFCDSGKLYLAGEEISVKSADECASIRAHKIGFVFQNHHLLPQLTAMENVLLPTLKTKCDNARSRAENLFEKVGLVDRRFHRPGHLSGGECQRVALCRALINSPLLLLADEPTGALDEKSSARLSELLQELNETEDLTVISVTHSKDFAASMKKVYHLVDGQLELV